MTLGTTLLTTLLIVYRIHSVMRNDGLRRTRSSFQDVLDLIVQSATPYAVACLMNAIVGAVPGNEFKLLVVQEYIGLVYCIIAVRL